MGRFSNIGKGRLRASKHMDTPQSGDPLLKNAREAHATAQAKFPPPQAKKKTKPKTQTAKPINSPPNETNPFDTSLVKKEPIKPTKKSNKRSKRKFRGSSTPSQRERVQSAAAPLHDRRRRLVGAREGTLRDLGGLMLEMYKRNRFREELLLDKCEEVLAIEVEIAHVDQRLFQLAPPNSAGMRPIGRCECGAPIHPGQNFCGVCGRSFATLTQPRTCTKCGSGLRPGDQYCAVCGNEAPDAIQAIELAAPIMRTADLSSPDPATIASQAVAQTVSIEVPTIDTPAPSDDLPASAPAIDLPDNTPPITEVTTPASLTESPSSATPSTFSWDTPSIDLASTVDAAIDTAIETSSASMKTSPSAQSSEISLPSTPDLAETTDVTVPVIPKSSVVNESATSSQTLPLPPELPPLSDITIDAPPPTGNPTPITIDAPPPNAAPTKLPPPGDATKKLPPPHDLTVSKRKLAKEAKARAKARAKEARLQRKLSGKNE